MGQYTDLVENTLTEMTSSAFKAKQVREALKAKFPKIKFSVRASNGSAINVTYKNAIPSKLVKDVAENFEEIDRDHMTGEILSGGNTFVFVTREIDQNFKDEARELVIKELNNDTINSQDIASIVHSFLETTDLSKKMTIKYNKRGSFLETFVGNMGNLK